jgi:hypothetical protein
MAPENGRSEGMIAACPGMMRFRPASIFVGAVSNVAF